MTELSNKARRDINQAVNRALDKKPSRDWWLAISCFALGVVLGMLIVLVFVVR